MDEPWGYFAKGHMTDTKRQILCNFTYTTFSKVVKFLETGSRMVVPRAWRRGEWGVVKGIHSFGFARWKSA